MPDRAGSEIGCSARCGGLGDVASLIADLSEFAEFAAIARRHLGRACSETEAASVDIVERLATIERVVGELVTFVDGSVNAPAVTTTLDRARAGMETRSAVMRRLAVEREADAAHAGERLAEVRAISRELGELVGGVNHIARHTQLISINAAIEAARAGPAGVGFAVIAAEVKDLARQTQEVMQKIGQGIQRLEESMGDAIQVIVHNRLEKERAGVADVTATFHDLGQDLASVIEHQQHAMAQVHAKSEAIVNPIIELAGSIQFQDVTRQQIEQVSHSIDKVADYFTALASSLREGRAMPQPTDSLAKHIEDMFDGYVMAQQRDAHRNGRGESQGAPIELF